MISDGLKVFNFYGHAVVHFNILNLIGVTTVKMPLITSIILFGSLYFMFKLRFVNFTQLLHGVKLILGGGHDTGEHHRKKEGEVSSIKSLFSSIAGAAGLGNVAGVAVAVSVAGPGAAFWMIVTPFVTMPLRFAEVFLGHKYREIDGENKFHGGPTYYMKKGLAELGLPRLGVWLAATYAFLLIVSGFGGASSFQVNQAVSVLEQNFTVLAGKQFMLSAIFVAVVAIVVFGGVKRIMGFLSTMMPILIGMYFCASIFVIAFNGKVFLQSVQAILDNALNIKAFGTGVAVAMVIGFNRIIVATETGLGTAASMHANSSNPDSVKEAIISMSSPLIDTFFVCFMSAMVVVVTGAYQGGHSGIIMTTKAFASVNSWFPMIVIIMVPFMALNVVIAWSFYGVQNCEYLFGKKSGKVYLVLYVAAAFAGGLVKNFDIIVDFTDIVNTVVAVPNIIAAVMLSSVVSKAYKNYLSKK